MQSGFRHTTKFFQILESLTQHMRFCFVNCKHARASDRVNKVTPLFWPVIQQFSSLVQISGNFRYISVIFLLYFWFNV